MSPRNDTFGVLRGDATKQLWKVTAEFSLKLDEKTTVPCIRLRSPNCGCSVYYSREEFDRLYRIVIDKPGAKAK